VFPSEQFLRGVNKESGARKSQDASLKPRRYKPKKAAQSRNDKTQIEDTLSGA
jgi:hypothetical protein